MPAKVAFDLDGTLLHTVADLAAAVNRMLADEGIEPLTQPLIQRFVGNGLPKLVERSMDHCGLPQDRHAELTRITLAHYNAAPTQNSSVYPGIPDALAALRDMGCSLGVCTNKPEAPARHILQEFDLLHFFDSVIGGDTLNTRKPDPAHLHACFDALPAAGPSIFVGDSEVDAETSARAKVPFLLYTKGYRKSPVSDLPHLAAYDDCAEIPDLVRQIVQNRTPKKC